MSSGDSDSESVVSSEVSSGGDLEAMMVLVTASRLVSLPRWTQGSKEAVVVCCEKQACPLRV